jgi:hypothetical protein
LFPLSPSSRSRWNLLLLHIWCGGDDFHCREEVYAVSTSLVSVTPLARHVPPVHSSIHPSSRRAQSRRLTCAVELKVLHSSLMGSPQQHQR